MMMAVIGILMLVVAFSAAFAVMTRGEGLKFALEVLAGVFGFFLAVGWVVLAIGLVSAGIGQ